MANEFPEATARFLYCVKCYSPQPQPMKRPTIQDRLMCSRCGMITTHRNAESVFDAEELRQAAEAALKELQGARPTEGTITQLRAALHPQQEEKGK